MGNAWDKALKKIATEDDKIRIEGIREIGNIKASECIPDLKRLLSESNEDIIVETVIAFRKIGDSSVAELIFPLLSHDYNLIRGETVLALGKLAEKGYSEAVEKIHPMIKDNNYFVRKCTVEALAGCGNEKSVDILLEYSNKEDTSLEVKQMINSTLGAIGGAKAMEALSKMVKEGQVEVRRSAIKALGESNYLGALELLAEVLEDKKEDKSIKIYAKAAIKNFLDQAEKRYLEFNKRVTEILKNA
jgi:HEAT repeat protein